jgi:riboflavin synthase
MFTGIIDHKFPVTHTQDFDHSRKITLGLNEALCKDLEIGASVAVNGVCLTAVQIEGVCVTFDVIKSTLFKTNIGTLKTGDLVNIERSLKWGSEVGGHEVSGHVDTTGTLISAAEYDQSLTCQFQLSPEWSKYIFPQGFVCINGASLTISNVDKDNHAFGVWLIPETLARTNLSNLKIGDKVNIEIHKTTQMVVDTIERVTERLLLSLIEKQQMDGTALQDLIKQIGG